MDANSTAPNKPRRGIYLLPNLFTTGALFAGFYAIIAAISLDYVDASLPIHRDMVFFRERVSGLNAVRVWVKVAPMNELCRCRDPDRSASVKSQSRKVQPTVTRSTR